MRLKQLFRSASLALCACLALASCGSDDGTVSDFSIFTSSNSRASVSSDELQFADPTAGDTIAIFSTDYGDISVVLYTELAPQACDNFIGLADAGFYDGTAISRIVSGFCVQGWLDADGQASTIWGDNAFPMEVSDSLHHYAGALCTAPDDDGTAASPFYFVQASASDVSDAMVSAMEEAGYREEVIATYSAAGGVPYLDYTDTVFGQIYDGMDVLDEIAALETDEDGTPVEEVLINNVTITTY